MPEDEFWSLIESMPSDPRDEDFSQLSTTLEDCGIDLLVSFEARLTLALYALDGPDNLDWFTLNDPSHFGYVSDDGFLYARCAAVLGGKESWSKAVLDHTLDWGADAPDLDGRSELLLYVGADAASAQGIDVGDYYETAYSEIGISYESGSNTALWGDEPAG